uniref:Uncharacterized protein n=1 Tax=Sphaerodactylus townsendi TaxID=933632 RepID=A0ACB8FIT4_9SAUR
MADKHWISDEEFLLEEDMQVQLVVGEQQGAGQPTHVRAASTSAAVPSTKAEKAVQKKGGKMVATFTCIPTNCSATPNNSSDASATLVEEISVDQTVGATKVPAALTTPDRTQIQYILDSGQTDTAQSALVDEDQ